MSEPLLQLDRLHVHLAVEAGIIQPVRGVSLSLARGETLAIVGESGCGKSLTALAVMGLLPPGGSVVSGGIRLAGTQLAGLSEHGWRRLRGRRVAMVFQNPMSAFNPTMRVGEQIAESMVRHRRLGWREASRRAVDLLERMHIPAPAVRARQYPFQFSGGMLQRAMIAMALAGEPELLIADEPTTALDVSVQTELLALLHELQREHGMALLLITHDLAVVAQIADRVAVMYAGQVVEQAPVDALFHAPAHPYTAALLRSLPERHGGGPLAAIAGSPPDLLCPPSGCAFYARCDRALRLCATAAVPDVVLDEGRQALCWLCHPAVVAAGAGDGA